MTEVFTNAKLRFVIPRLVSRTITAYPKKYP